MNDDALVPVWVSGFVTTTSTTPPAWAAVVQVIPVVLVLEVMVQVLPPTVTIAALSKPVPVTVTDVPPAVGPDSGDTEVIDGGAMYVSGSAAKLAVTERASVSNTVHEGEVPAAVQLPDHPEKVELLDGDAVSVTNVPQVCDEHPVPHECPEGLDVTVPLPVPIFETDNW